MKVTYLKLKQLLEEIQEVPEEEFTPLKVQTIIVRMMDREAH